MTEIRQWIALMEAEAPPKRRAIKHGRDGKDRKLALVDNGDGSFTVLVKSPHYASHVRGGIAYTWGWAGTSQRMPQEEAEALFNRRNKIKP
jgi:hypothetical protein